MICILEYYMQCPQHERCAIACMPLKDLCHATIGVVLRAKGARVKKLCLPLPLFFCLCT